MGLNLLGLIVILTFLTSGCSIKKIKIGPAPATLYLSVQVGPDLVPNYRYISFLNPEKLKWPYYYRCVTPGYRKDPNIPDPGVKVEIMPGNEKDAYLASFEVYDGVNFNHLNVGFNLSGPRELLNVAYLDGITSYWLEAGVGKSWVIDKNPHLESQSLDCSEVAIRIHN